MFEEEYRKEMEAVGPDREQMERLLAAMEQKGRRPRPLRRTILLVAAGLRRNGDDGGGLGSDAAGYPGGIPGGHFAPYAQPVEAAGLHRERD